MTGTQIAVLGIILAIIILIIVKTVLDRFRAKKKLLKRIREAYGSVPDPEAAARREEPDYYFRSRQEDTQIIDDITWNDLDMDDIFALLNSTWTGIGEEYLYDALRRPVFDTETLAAREEKADWLYTHDAEREKLSACLIRLGKPGTFSVCRYIDALRHQVPFKTGPHILLLAVLIAVIAATVRLPYTFGPVLIFLLIINMVTYYIGRNKISAYFKTFAYMSHMVTSAIRVGESLDPFFGDTRLRLLDSGRKLQTLGRWSWFFSSGTDLGADLLGLILDYLKMLTHIDLILYGVLTAQLRKEDDDLQTLMREIGELDICLAIASYRKLTQGQWCIPVLDNDKTLSFSGIRHPLLTNAVPNDLVMRRPVLITGSNASGKSTFLKAAALGAIMAQTIHTCLADAWASPILCVYSSMALRDDLSRAESYFMAEIRSLKRILTAKPTFRIFCVIDEVLRGTNTIERIAASSRILSQLAQEEILCIAATHDIELTGILAAVYDNYHFRETIKDDDILFDYKLIPGAAVSRNAIRLLDLMGFDKAITGDALAAAQSFEETGIWQPLKGD